MTAPRKHSAAPAHPFRPVARLVLVVASLGSGRLATAQEVAAAPPACTPLQEAVWTRIATEQLGLAARDATADRRYVGPLANFKKGAGFRRGALGGRNWYPADVVKRTLCGQLDRLELFHTSFTDHEADFHQFIDPFPPYQYLSSDVAPIATAPRSTYGEITLPGEIWRNPPWFNLPTHHTLMDSRVVPSPRKDGGLDGSPVCIYGPWVFEDFHANQPEIHPAQQMWWRVASKDEIRWLVAQDVSNRFHREMYYCDVAGAAKEEICDATRPKDFVAWAPPSLAGEALLAYELDATTPESRQLTVFLDRSDGVGPGAPVVQDTRRFEVPGGVSQLTVSHPPNPERAEGATLNATRMSVSFQTQDECVSATRKGVLGYVTVRVVLDREQAARGFAQVGVRGLPRRIAWPEEGQPGDGTSKEPLPPIIATPGAALHPRGGVLYVDWVPPSGTGDVLTLTGPDGSQQIAKSRGAFELPLLGVRGPLTVLADGRSFRIPEVRLEANFKPIGAKAGAQSVTTGLRVAYGSTRDKGGEQLAEDLNDRLSGWHWEPSRTFSLAWHHKRFYGLFGNAKCFEARLSATVTPEGGDEAAVEVQETCDGSRPAAGTPVRVCALQRSQGCQWAANDQIVDVRVDAQRDFRGLVTLTATATDPFGNSSEPAARRIGLPYSAGNTLDRLVADMAGAAGLQDGGALRRLGDLSRSGPGSASSELDLGTGICGARERRARLLMLFARYVAVDGGGNADYQRLLRLAQNLRSTPQDDGACRDAAAARPTAKRR